MSSGIVHMSCLATQAWTLFKKLEDVANAPTQLEKIKQQTRTTQLIVDFFRYAYTDFQKQANCDSASDEEEWNKRADLAEDIVVRFNKAMGDVDHVVSLVIDKNGRMRERFWIKLKVVMNKSLLKITYETMTFVMLQMSTFTSICNLHRDNMKAAAIKRQDKNAELPEELRAEIDYLKNRIEDLRNEASAAYTRIFRLAEDKEIQIGPTKEDLKEFRKIGAKLDRRAKKVVEKVKMSGSERGDGRSHKSSSRPRRPAPARRRSSVYSFMGYELFESRFDSNDSSLPQEPPQHPASTRSSSRSTRSSYTPPTVATSSASLPSFASSYWSSGESNSFHDSSNSGRTTRSSSSHGSAVHESCAADDPMPSALRTQLKEKVKQYNSSEENILQRKRIRRKMKAGKSAVPVAPFTPSDAGFPDDE